MRRGEGASGPRDTSPAVVCGCVPDPAHQAGVGVLSGCACQGVERVVRREKTRSVTDIVKVIAFAMLLAALVLALVLWWA